MAARALVVAAPSPAMAARTLVVGALAMPMAASAALAAALALLLVPPTLIALRRLQLLDRPSERSSHLHPTPRGGGLAPALAAAVAVWASPHVVGDSARALVLAAAAFGLIGLIDDVRGVPALRRLALQALAAALALPWVLDAMTGPSVWRAVFTAGALVWLVAYVNAFNFMDGINGISVAQVTVAGAAWFLIGRAEEVDVLAAGGLVVAGAAAGFAPFNFPRARVFLGDVGSYFLGAWLAVLVVLGLRAGLPPEAVVAPLALYLADTAATIVRRVRRGERWYLAHRDHAYQRLTQLGWTHTRTTLVVAAVMAVSAGLGSLSLTGSLPLRVAADTALALVLLAYLASPRLVVRARREPVAAVARS